MAQHQTWKGGIACKIQGHQEISRKESCFSLKFKYIFQGHHEISCSHLSWNISNLSQQEKDNLRKWPFQKWREKPGLAPRENPVRLGHQLFQRQALAINTIAFAELVQGLEGMEHEDMMRIGKQNHKQNSHKLIQVIDSDEKTYPLDSITLFSERFPWFPNPIYWGFQIICSIDLL